MLQFKQNESSAVMILTLTELVDITPLYYLFVFTHVITKDVVAFVKSQADDQSAYPNRYNQFTINASTVFTGKQSGEWHYVVYQQESSSNTDPESADGILEYGKLMLDRSTEFEFTMYDTSQTFKAYNG